MFTNKHKEHTLNKTYTASHTKKTTSDNNQSKHQESTLKKMPKNKKKAKATRTEFLKDKEIKQEMMENEEAQDIGVEVGVQDNAARNIGVEVATEENQVESEVEIAAKDVGTGVEVATEEDRVVSEVEIAAKDVGLSLIHI